ncbi:MAG: glycosyltransferase [Chloroflexi bacterium]|nr:glycosyltransferase [Chloroflexota bacterium]
MKVTWLTSTYPWAEQPMGGIFFQAQAQALVRRGAHVSIVTPTPWAPFPLSSLRTKWRLYSRSPGVSEDGAVRIFRPRYLNVPGQPSMARPDRLIAQAALRYPQVWAGAGLVHGHFAVEALAAAHVARRTGLPLALTFHGSDINTWPQDHPDRVADLAAAVRQADLVTAVSRALVERIHSLTGVEAQHLPIGSNHHRIIDDALTRQAARRAVGIAEDRVVVLFVGNLLRPKGVRELADAIMGLGHPFLAVFVGEGPESGYGSNHPRMGGLLEYRGQRDHTDVVRFMSAADVLVLPSYGEGLPTVLVEAGTLGLPVIASAVGGIPDLLGDGRGTVLPDVSAEAVARAVTHFIEHRNEAQTAADRLQRYVREEHDVDRNAARLLDMYRAVLRPRRNGATER